ncbi:MAG TPA: branched-chain amino acid ABC transporter ATP-binding protein/permease [Trueperaceae bacterium]
MRRALALTFILLVLAAPWLLPSFYLTLLDFVGMYSLVVMGLVLLTGHAGLASLGQAAFMAAGAYTSAIVSSRLPWNPWLGILSGILLASLIAWIIGLVTLRLKGHFLALATLAWGIIITGILRNWVDLTGGNTGYGIGPEQHIPTLSLFGLELRESWHMYYLIWACVLLVLWLSQNLMRSRAGRAIKALRTGTVAAASFGVNTAHLKMQVFVLAAAYAALAGGLYAFLFRYISPGPFDLGTSIDVLIMAVLGGLSSLWGAIFGAGLFVALQEALQRTLPSILGQGGNYEGIAFGLLLILVLQQARRGLLPLLSRLLPPAPPEPVRPAAPLPSRPRQPNAGPLLQLDDVSKRFGGLTAVDHVSFELQPTEILGVIGPNGAGKTTLFNLITGVLSPSSGRILFRDHDISHQAPERIARLGLARTFQHLNLIGELSLLENVALGAHSRTHSGIWAGMLALERHENARVRAAALRQLERVGLAEHAFELARNLPLGNQRLLEVARALMADPLLLLLDEPAAGLRAGEKTELMTLLRRLQAEGITILLVEHDMHVVMQLADRIVVMNYGQKLTEGTPTTVQRDPRVLEAYLGREAA